MKIFLFSSLPFVLAFVFILPASSTATGRSPLLKTGAPVFVNVIEGIVYGPNKRPIPDLWVELQNDLNTTYGRTRTSSSGRYQFSGMRAGHYVIHVYTTGTDLEEQSESVDLINIVSTASDAAYQDFDLRPRKTRTQALTSDIVFAQEVPPEALKLYRSGNKELSEKDPAKGRAELEAALKIFPQYFEALNALGCSYVETKEYSRSLRYLIAAINLNQRSFSSYYALAYAGYKLGQVDDATLAASAAVTLSGESVNAQLLYGTLLALGNQYDKALPPLLKAEKLSKANPIAEVHWQLAMTLNRLKRDEEAVKHLETYLKLAPDAPNRAQVQDLIRKLEKQSKPQSYAVIKDQ